MVTSLKGQMGEETRAGQTERLAKLTCVKRKSKATVIIQTVYHHSLQNHVLL